MYRNEKLISEQILQAVESRIHINKKANLKICLFRVYF